MGVENLGSIMAWKHPTLRQPDDYAVRNTGSGITLEWNQQSQHPDMPDPLPTALDVMAFEGDWQDFITEQAAEDTQYGLDRQAILDTADQAITDLGNGIDDVVAYLGSNPLNKTNVEVREQVRDNCVIMREELKIVRAVVRLLKYAVKRGRL